MSKKFIIIDTLNMIHRAKHVTQSNDLDLKIGMSFHILFNSLRKVYRDFQGEHPVFCLEGHSWRKEIYPDYKLNRKVLALSQTPKEQEENDLFMEACNELMEFFVEKTNATTLQHPRAEADDMIAMFTQSHPDDHHVIVSSDTDFYQLLAPNVEIYNGITEQHITIDGIFDVKGRPVIDKKTKLPKPAFDPEWELFKKCIRGDKTDWIFPAYPGAREKGTKNNIGMRDAFADRISGGYSWNNFMLTKLIGPDEKEYRVKDKYEFNKILIDLTQQPDDVRLECLEEIATATSKEPIRNVGIHFLKFCKLWDLANLAKYPDDFAKILNSRYGA